MDVQIDVTNIRLETPRLLMRAWQKDDLDDLYEYASVEDVGRSAGWKRHESIEETRTILQSFIADKNVFALIDKTDGKAIGSLGLHRSWANDVDRFADLKVKEIGYVLAKPYWGQGLMTEAVGKIIEFCFTHCGLDALTVGHFTDNARSKRVVEKCGFTYVRQGVFHSASLQKDFIENEYILFRR